MAAGQWDALVLDDYQAVMPLTWRSKFGIRYLYQPAFTQQTGIFSASPFHHHLDRILPPRGSIAIFASPRFILTIQMPTLH